MSQKTKKEYYVVIKGKRPGIYRTWFGADGASDQIQGVPDAVYKGFFTREEAVAWLREMAATDLLELLGLDEQLTKPPDYLHLLEAGKVVIYTDGGAINNPGPGGFGVVLLAQRNGQLHRKELSQGYRLTTNNRAEIMACIAGLEALKTPCEVIVHSDSRYVVDAMMEGWAKRWRAQGWFRNKKDPAENSDLWGRLLELSEQHQVEFRWVKGHAGNRENERCDELAMASARGGSWLIDEPYESGQTRPASLLDL